jgi:ABC-2 type transport system permease protein
MTTATSYRAGFALNAAGALANILAVFFLSEAVSAGTSPMLEPYGGSYFGFAIVGVALTNFMALGLSGIGGRLREGMMTGTLEFMLLSPNRLAVLLLGSSLWSHTFATASLVLYFVIGAALGMDLSGANGPMALLGFALAVISFNGLGLIAASVVILIKQGDPVTWLVSGASILLAGVFYPTTVLPPGLQALGQLLPLTHALEVVRRALFNGEGIDTLWPSVLALAVLAGLSLLVGLWACRTAVRIAQRDGSLAYY